MFYPFEYHNDRNNLYYDYVPNLHGLLPSTPHPVTRRLVLSFTVGFVRGVWLNCHRESGLIATGVCLNCHRGSGLIATGDEDQQNQAVEKYMEASGLSLWNDDVKVQDVLLWMKERNRWL